jgi:hypothetical protein
MPRASASLASVMGVLLFATSATAHENPMLEGSTSEDWKIYVRVSEHPIVVEVARREPGTQKFSSQHFLASECTFEQENDKGRAALRTLTCAPSGSSPLAGTRYIGRSFGGTCERGDPDFVYRCVRNCSKSVPVKMIQGHYEC